jgi:antitoxin YqcF
VSNEISIDNREIVQITSQAFGGDWRVLGYADPREESKIDVLQASDRPSKGLTSYATIGLSDYPLPGETTPPIGSEITACSNREGFGNVLATAAFYVINDGWIPQPGRIFTDVVAIHFGDTSTPHLFLVNPPWLWEGLRARTFTQKTVGWLMGLPITNAEMKYIGEQGAETFEDLFLEKDPDFIDLVRPSIV